MHAWVFRHLDELQRIYSASECPPSPPLGFSAEGTGPFANAAAPGAPPDACPFPAGGPPANSGPFADGTSIATAIPPGSVLRQETDEGPEVLLMPRRPARRRTR